MNSKVCCWIEKKEQTDMIQFAYFNVFYTHAHMSTHACIDYLWKENTQATGTVVSSREGYWRLGEVLNLSSHTLLKFIACA